MTLPGAAHSKAPAPPQSVSSKLDALLDAPAVPLSLAKSLVSLFLACHEGRDRGFLGSGEPA